MEETNDVSKKSIAFKYGIVGGLIGIIVFVVQDFTGISSDPSLSWIGTVLSIVISAAIITVGHNEFKKNGDGFMNYGEGLGLGTLISLEWACIRGFQLFRKDSKHLLKHC